MLLGWMLQPDRQLSAAWTSEDVFRCIEQQVTSRSAAVAGSSGQLKAHLVPEAKSSRSTSATFSPRVAASHATPAPTQPPPITTMSKVSSFRRRSCSSRVGAAHGMTYVPSSQRIGNGLRAAAAASSVAEAELPDALEGWLPTTLPPHDCPNHGPPRRPEVEAASGSDEQTAEDNSAAGARTHAAGAAAAFAAAKTRRRHAMLNRNPWSADG